MNSRCRSRQSDAISIGCPRQGCPVYAQPGRGGGWQLGGGGRTDLTGLTEDEAIALFWPGEEVEITASARRKVLQALPEPFQKSAEAAHAALLIDTAKWGKETPAQCSPAVAIARRALLSGRRLTIDYAPRGQSTRQRVVDPLGVIDKQGIWYLLALSAGSRRVYRVDRIAAAQVSDEPAQVPHGADLEALWQQATDEIEELRGGLQADIWIATSQAGILLDQLGRQAKIVETRGARTRITVAAPTARMIAQHLAGWGGLIEVASPTEVREELVVLGQELVQANS